MQESELVVGRHRAPRATARFSLRTRRPVLAVACVAGTAALIATGAPWGVVDASFKTTTSNSSSWSTGTVVLGTSPSGVLFTGTNLQPGSTATGCVDVTYSGSLAGSVKLYGSVSPSGAGTLSTYLRLTIEEGTGTCASFSSPVTDFTGTAATFAATYTGWSTGLGSWTVSGSSSVSRPFRITYLLMPDNAARSLSGSVSFTWQAQNS